MTETGGDYILVIEDDPGVRNGIANIIENEGYTVVSCSDAQTALDSLSSAANLPRMILLDFLMPHMDGWAFLRERQKDVRLRSIPVLGMSASQVLLDRKEPPEDVEEFLRKPFNVDAMLQSIEKHWRAPPP
jgi:CheY-like chemotaxis protein